MSTSGCLFFKGLLSADSGMGSYGITPSPYEFVRE